VPTVVVHNGNTGKTINLVGANSKTTYLNAITDIQV